MLEAEIMRALAYGARRAGPVLWRAADKLDAYPGVVIVPLITFSAGLLLGRLMGGSQK